jgi:hypothetical protein
MTIEEFEKSKKKNYKWIIFAIPIALIATCNVYLNTHQENAIIKNPEAGDFFVFRGLIGNYDQPFKLKKIANDTMEFFIPKYEVIDFEINKSESKIYELDKKNELFDSIFTMKIPKTTVDSLIKNSDFSVRVNNHPAVYLKGVFGRTRENAVDNAFKKLADKGIK